MHINVLDCCSVLLADQHFVALKIAEVVLHVAGCDLACARSLALLLIETEGGFSVRLSCDCNFLKGFSFRVGCVPCRYTRVGPAPAITIVPVH